LQPDQGKIDFGGEKMNRSGDKSFCASILLILGCLVAFSQSAGGQSAADINKAKQVLSKMGITMEGLRADGLARSATFVPNVAPREGRVEKPRQALEFGIGFASLADPRPTPVQPGTKVYFTIGDKGKIVFYLNEWNMMKDTSNQPTPVHVNPTLLSPGIEVNYGSFPARI
jgi:hypothetical protein